MSEKEEKQPILQCPHCSEFIIIEEINCGIFRHGYLKDGNKQIDPHADKKLCDYYFNKNMIYGCGKPFKITKEITGETQINKDNEKYIIEACDYI